MKISESLQKTLPLLKLVSKLPKKNRDKILAMNEVGGDKIFYNAFHELAFNALKGRLKLEKPQLKKFKSNKKVLERICNLKNKNCVKKRKKVIQKGSNILPILIPAIFSILSSVISKNG